MKIIERTRRANKIRNELNFCATLFDKLRDDFADTVECQDNDPYDGYYNIKNHTRFKNDVIRLRRELLVVEKLFDEE